MTDSIEIEHTTFGLMGPIVHSSTQTMPIHSVIFTIGDRVILLDTGFGVREMTEPNKFIGEEALFRLSHLVDPRLTALHRLRERGVGPEQVTDIILTHLDNDHAGGVHDFPNATVHLSLEELGSFDSGTPRGPYKPYQAPHGTKFEAYGPSSERWFGLEARTLRLPGGLEAKLIPLPGHTWGHCGVAYREEGKWSLLAADAYFDAGVSFSDHAYGLPIEVAFQTSSPDRLESLAKLRALKAAHGAEVNIFCAHDQNEFLDWTVGRGKPDALTAPFMTRSVS